VKTVLFFGSDDFTWKRPINRAFLDLRPDMHIVCCVDDTGPGRIALRTAKALGFQTRVPPWDNEIEGGDWDDMYWFTNTLDDMPDNALVFGKRLHAFVSRRPDPRPPKATPPETA
jgi:hypothetical protein